MKTYTLHYLNPSELQLFLEQKPIPDSDKTLVMVFCGKPGLVAVKDVQTQLRKYLPNTVMIGATTSGEILDGQLYDGSIIISFTVFSETSLQLISFPYIYRDYELAGREFAHQLFSQSTKAALIFATAFNTNGEDFVHGIGSVRPDVCIAGGSCSHLQSIT